MSATPPVDEEIDIPETTKQSDIDEDKNDDINTDEDDEKRKKQIYTYEAPWTIYAMGFDNNPSDYFTVALGSFVEEYSNKIKIVKKFYDEDNFTELAEFPHPYPATKVMFSPPGATNLGLTDESKTIIATTGDYLRLWKVDDRTRVNNDEANDDTMKTDTENNDYEISFIKLLNNQLSEFCAPLTSFDWNLHETNVIGTSSLDSTCTMWDINTGVATSQIITHDKEVFDIQFSPKPNFFSTVGIDGSLRLFDLRDLTCSTIIYETEGTPLLRLVWNLQDPNYIATIGNDVNSVIILDVRVPATPVEELGAHDASLNGIAWAPHSACHLCSCSDDKQAFIWDLSSLPKQRVEDPILAYNAGAEINNLQWYKHNPDWVGITFENKLQILRV